MSNQSINALNIPSIQNNKQIYFQQSQQNPAMQGNTAMQGMPQNVGDTELGNRVKNSSDMAQSPYTLPVAAGTWYAIAQGMDSFGRKCGGTYDESILGKFTGKADALSDKVTNSKFANSRFGQWLGNTYNSISSYIDKASSNPKNRLLYALKNHKTTPECKLVKTPAAGLAGFLEADTRQVFEEFLKPTKYAEQLKQYGKTNDEVNAFLDSVKGLSKQEKMRKLQEEELKYFGKKASDIAGKTSDELAKMLKELKITKGLGFNSVAHYEKVMKEEYALKHMDEILQALRKGDQNLKISIWKKDGWTGKVLGHLFGRDVGIAELANKFDLTLKTGAKTKFGKFVGKSFGYLTEGCTNRFAGGKVAVAMQAFIFADMLIHTFNAPKGEKGKTLAERFVNDFTYFLALPVGIWAMHKAGGLKYLGMSKEQVKAYEENLKLFKEGAKNKLYTKKGFKMRSKVLNRQLNAGVKNPFLKLIKKAANILTVGLNQKPVYLSKSSSNLNLLRKLGYWTKNAAGYPIRFAIPMMLISPILAKWATKATHTVFGRPTKSVLDEEEEASTTDKTDTTAAAAAAMQNKPQTIQQPGQVSPSQKSTLQHKSPNDYKSDTNLIKMTANGTKPQLTQQAKADNNKEQEPLRTYIPSPIGMVQQPAAPTGLDAAFAQADETEKYVNDILAMKIS